jgi:hypothetical protein
MGKYYQGFFTPKNKNKYIGNIRNIVYRSSWELKFMIWCDEKEDIKKWSSEEIRIPYILNNKVHNYYVDFYVEREIDNEIKKFIIEIKPYNKLLKPKVYNTMALEEWNKNYKKYEAAEQFAKNNGINFVILTEKELNIKKQRI